MKEIVIFQFTFAMLLVDKESMLCFPSLFIGLAVGLASIQKGNTSNCFFFESSTKRYKKCSQAWFDPASWSKTHQTANADGNMKINEHVLTLVNQMRVISSNDKPFTSNTELLKETDWILKQIFIFAWNFLAESRSSGKSTCKWWHWMEEINRMSWMSFTSHLHAEYFAAQTITDFLTCLFFFVVIFLLDAQLYP